MQIHIAISVQMPTLNDMNKRRDDSIDNVLEKLSMHPSLHFSFQLQVGWVSQPLLSTRDLPTYLLHVKRDESYIRWMRCRLGFALTRSAIMCLRGCRSIHSNNAPHQSPNALWRDRFPHLIEVAKNCIDHH